MLTGIMIASLAQLTDTGYYNNENPVIFNCRQTFATESCKNVDSISNTESAIFIDVNMIEKLGDNYFRLESFRLLKSGWDGYGACTIPEGVISRAQELLMKIAPSNLKPQVFPTGRGTVQIEYYIDDDNQVEIEVFLDYDIAFVVSHGEELEKTVDLEEAAFIMDNFAYGRTKPIS